MITRKVNIKDIQKLECCSVHKAHKTLGLIRAKLRTDIVRVHDLAKWYRVEEEQLLNIL